MNLLETRYKYIGELEFRNIYVDLDTGYMVKRECYKDKFGNPFNRQKIYKPRDREFHHLWNEYGKPAVVEYVRMK